MTVIKRTAKNSVQDLISAIDQFIPFLTEQGEDDAVTDMQSYRNLLSESEKEDDNYKKALEGIVDAFEDTHELSAYTFHRETTEWTEKEELAQISSRVFTLAKRLLK